MSIGNPAGPARGERVQLTITLSAEDFEFARNILALDDARARDEFFTAAIDALRMHVDATRHYLEQHGLGPNDPLPLLRYDVIVRPAPH